MVTIEEVRKLAVLAKLRLTEEELEHMTKDLSSIITFADTINAVSEDAKDRAALPQGETDRSEAALRPDAVTPSVSPGAILLNAGGGENGYFRIRKRK